MGYVFMTWWDSSVCILLIVSDSLQLMMKMSSTDTPLGTLTMLKHKQLETHSPYIVLSGSKQIQPSIVKK